MAMEMMHQPSARRKGKSRPPKRIQIHDEEGWTHVTTTSRRTPAHLPSVADVLVPAEAPDGLTLKRLKKQYEWHKKCWEESQTWEKIRQALENGMMTSATNQIDNCVCVGLGSPSGLLRGGWVDRRVVSLYQLAALATILEYFAHEDTPSRPIQQCYAQDPVFNTLDKQLLESIGILVVQDPEAFSLVNERTFLYSPGAERSHLTEILASDPTLFFGGPLDDSNPARLYDISLEPKRNPSIRFKLTYIAPRPDKGEDVLSRFLTTRRSMLLPQFDPNIPAFWMTSLFWKPEDT
ncbi:hypothetical protein FQN53_009778 [Emmonsiellopsis sp. PD_33]|nr:hypothetical protein FQN53_009778 [Emmonsiellopsis sp. PD_33]